MAEGKLFDYIKTKMGSDYDINNDVALPYNVGDIALGTMAATGYNALGYLPYITDIYNGLNLLFHKPFNKMTPDEFKQYGDIGRKYYQEHLQNNPVNIKGYGLIEFGKTNRGKDKTINMEQYPFLRKNLKNSKKEDFTTNYKNEEDRNYDYFSNKHKNNLYHYLIEDIKDVGKRYKMMKNKTNGE